MTNSRALGSTDEERRTLAEAMNHSLATANRFYNYSSVNSSVVSALDRSMDERPRTSTPKKTEQELPGDDGPSRSSANELMRQKYGEEDRDSDGLDRTIRTLRNKKVKRLNPVPDQISNVRSKIERISKQSGIAAKMCVLPLAKLSLAQL